MIKPFNLRCEYQPNPLGTDVVQPRLSWTLTSDERGQIQAAYRILVSDNLAELAAQRGNLWDSGRIESNQSAQVVYAGSPLSSEQRCYWRVQVWDRDEQLFASEPTWWQIGLFHADDWSARWISHDTKATLHLPTGDAAAVSEGDLPAVEVPGIRFESVVEESAVFTAGSGTYTFACPYYQQPNR